MLLSPAALQRARKPNFIVLFTDDQRFDTIGALGNPDIRTPHMDRLARRGLAFTQASIMGGTQGAVCVPSRAMLMTGQSLFHAARNTGATPGDNTPPLEFHLMPEYLKQNGYSTFHTGKWHNGPRLHARCFTGGAGIFFGGMSDQEATPVQEFDPTGAYPKERAQKGGKFSSELFTDAALGFLEKQKAGQPFLLYCAYTSPHDPRTAPSKFASLYDPARLKLPPNFLPQHPFDNGELKVRDELLAPFPRTPEVVRRHLADYYAMVSEVDAQIGRVLDAVDRSPFANDTYIIFAGDNGLAVGQHGLFGKQNVYDHSVRVPLIVSGPDVPKDKRTGALAYLYDLFPTVCELAGLPVPGTVDGLSLKPLFDDPSGPLRDSTFHAYRHFQRAIRTRDWKLIRYTLNGKETLQLFHLAKDPWERNDVSRHPAHAAKIRELSAKLMGWQKRTGDPLAL